MNACPKCQKEKDRAYELAIDSRRTTEDQAAAILARKHLCDKHAAEALGADAIGRRNAYDGTPWTHYGNAEHGVEGCMTGERIYWMEVDGKRTALREKSLSDAFAAIRNVVPKGTVIACTGVEDV